MDTYCSTVYLLILINVIFQWLQEAEALLQVKPSAIYVYSNGTSKPGIQHGDVQILSLTNSSEVLFSCLEELPNDVLDRPHESVIWFWNGNILETSRRKKYHDYKRRKELLIKKLSHKDSGIYECALISNTSEKGIAELWIAPEVIAAPASQTLNLDSRGIIECIVTDGIREVEWQKDNQTIASSNGTVVDIRYKVLSSGSLQISNVTQQDSGQYGCIVSNKAGKVSKEINVTVTNTLKQSSNDHCVVQLESDEELTQEREVPFQIIDKPFFTLKPPGCIQSMEGFNVILKCSADSYPKPNITWMRNNANISEEIDRYTQLSDGSLKISAVQKADSGEYICQASTIHWTRSVSVHLKVTTMDQVCGIGSSINDGSAGSGSIGGLLMETGGDRERRVVEGQVSNIHNWPWQVLIEYNSTSTDNSIEPLCGGSLIRPDWIITAAHCLYDIRGNLFTSASLIVRAGVFNRTDSTEQNQQVLEVDHYIIHTIFSKNRHHDIALLKLAHPAKPTKHVGFICLPVSRNHDVVPGTLCTVTGWGHLEFMAGISPDVLHSAEVPVVTNRQCGSDESYNMKITYNLLCAGWRDGGPDACQNDSGGPLVCQTLGDRWVLYGVVNTGEGCGHPYKYGIYARVANYIRWINSVIQN